MGPSLDTGIEARKRVLHRHGTGFVLDDPAGGPSCGTTHAPLQRARLSVRGLTANQCDSDMPHRAHAAFASVPVLLPFRSSRRVSDQFPRRCRSDRLCISLTLSRFGDCRAYPAPWSLKCEHQQAEPVPVRDTALHSTRLLQGLTSTFECKRLRSAIVRLHRLIR